MPRRPVRAGVIVVLAIAWTWTAALPAIVWAADDTAKPKPIVIDTDIGAYPDDAFALALALASPEFDVKAVTTVGGETDDRAWLVCRFLTQCGRKGIPVAGGADPQPDNKIDWQIQYRRHPAAIFNRTLKPVGKPAHEVLYDVLKGEPEKVTVLGFGPLTNIARLLKEHPDAKDRIERIVLMGGALRIGYKVQPSVEPEWNIRIDISAARAVLASGLPITVLPLDATVPLVLDAPRRKQLFDIHTPTAFQVQNLLELWETEANEEPATLYDTAVVAAALGLPFFEWSEVGLTVDDKGVTRAAEGKSTTRIAMGVAKDKLLDWAADRLARTGEVSLPKPPGNPSKLIARGRFPARVHTFEDYDTDIEKRWWMCGKVETRDVSPGGTRVCRAVLTQDFDDRQGDMKTMYRAVIFNPVPGPPMGPKTRLSFRYKLHGTDTLRVQLYSLTNGYHRYLSVKGLPQDVWSDGTVDMTDMRRPDGSGGALAADERIDDIQFYIDPRAELLIDDVVLYDEGEERELRTYPNRIVFTGWFDTGKQGKEWPGTLEILSHQPPRTWKFAQSIEDESTKQPELRVSFRGERKLGRAPQATFDYLLTGADKFEIQLYRAGEPILSPFPVEGSKPGEWRSAHGTFRSPKAIAANPDAGAADELRFLLSKGAKLQIDNLLVFEPGQ